MARLMEDPTLHDALGTEPANTPIAHNKEVLIQQTADRGYWRRRQPTVKASQVTATHLVDTGTDHVVARVGDWIVEMENGIQSVFTDEGFRATFEKAGPRR